jgi:hypothetical protein
MPSARASSSTPRATSLKNGFAASITTYAMVLLCPARSWRAVSLRTKPSSTIAACTRSRVASLTSCGRFSTFDTVPMDTPATAATSFMPGVLSVIPRPASAGGPAPARCG